VAARGDAGDLKEKPSLLCERRNPGAASRRLDCFVASLLAMMDVARRCHGNITYPSRNLYPTVTETQPQRRENAAKRA
jgi:hypothetical protein